MALNTWQKLTRVLPGRPFGIGIDGDLTISSSTTQSVAKAGCYGNSGGSSLVLDTASTFINGDVVSIHQSRGTGVGQWEINKIKSGGGTTTLTLEKKLQYTYTDSGASQAQIFKIPMYRNVTLNSSIVWSAPDWNGNIGGNLLFAAKESLTIAGTIESDGGAGGSNISVHNTGGGSGGGYRGGNAWYLAGGGPAFQGEGTVGAGGASSGAANGSGGGGGGSGIGGSDGPGGGGGHATVGESNPFDPARAGDGGLASGTANLTTMTFGGGGGGSSVTPSNKSAGGGSGAGIVIIFAKNIASITGGISLDGGAGGSATGGIASSGGAGGSCLIVCQTASLGTNKITARGGVGGGGSVSGVAGSVGRIAVHHSQTVTGTTSPTFSDTEDLTLVETGGFSPIFL